MIVFDLRCGSGHVFEGWFGSGADYEEQQGRGLVQCPACGSAEVAKSVMAPRIGSKSGPADPDEAKRALALLAAQQKKLLAGSEHVGDRFAAEARAIHLGEADARAIHGRATRAEAESLAEDGIPVAPLPFPVVDPAQEN